MKKFRLEKWNVIRYRWKRSAYMGHGDAYILLVKLTDHVTIGKN